MGGGEGGSGGGGGGDGTRGERTNMSLKEVDTCVGEDVGFATYCSAQKLTMTDYWQREQQQHNTDSSNTMQLLSTTTCSRDDITSKERKSQKYFCGFLLFKSQY